MKLRSKADFRGRRHRRLRQKVTGTADRPRMCVLVSGRHMYVQFVDDTAGRTLAAVSTLPGGRKSGGKNNVAIAKDVGKRAAESAKQKGIVAVVFDRGGHPYRGRVKALADAAREAGLKF